MREEDKLLIALGNPTEEDKLEALLLVDKIKSNHLEVVMPGERRMFWVKQQWVVLARNGDTYNRLLEQSGSISDALDALMREP